MSKLATSLLLLITAFVMPLAAAAEATAPARSEVSTIGIMPHRGMTMEQVKQNFGEPVKVIAAVGKPPISRWIYDGFVVYFENNHVVHALMTTENTQ